MQRAELLNMFRKMATEIAEKDYSNVAEGDTIAKLGLDSLNMLELIGAMERELEIQIPDDELIGIESVKQLIELVESKVTPKTA